MSPERIDPWCFQAKISMGVSENVVYPFLPNGFADQTIPLYKWLYFIGNIITQHFQVQTHMVLLIIIPTIDGYFIGGIPYFQTYPLLTIINHHYGPFSDKPIWFCWSLSLLNGYFIGGIPNIFHYPVSKWLYYIELGRLTQHFQTNPDVPSTTNSPPPFFRRLEAPRRRPGAGTARAAGDAAGPHGSAGAGLAERAESETGPADAVGCHGMPWDHTGDGSNPWYFWWTPKNSWDWWMWITE